MKKIFIKRKYSHRQKRFKKNFYKKFFNKKKRFSKTKRIQKDFHKKKRFSQMILSKNKCVNSGSIGGLIEVHVSSIVKWGYQDNFKTDFFFFMKRFHMHKKHQNTKQATFTFLEVCVHKKPLPLLLFVRLFLFCWLMLACECFCAFKSFS